MKVNGHNNKCNDLTSGLNMALFNQRLLKAQCSNFTGFTAEGDGNLSVL